MQQNPEAGTASITSIGGTKLYDPSKIQFLYETEHEENGSRTASGLKSRSVKGIKGRDFGAASGQRISKRHCEKRVKGA